MHFERFKPSKTLATRKDLVVYKIIEFVIAIVRYRVDIQVYCIG